MRPTDVTKATSVIGVWATASRQKNRHMMKAGKKPVNSGPFQQVSRLGNPLFNEVITPMAEKDEWNATPPSADKAYAKYVAKPELAGLLPVLYPNVFPNLAGYTKSRADLLAILLTGIPNGVVKGFQNYTGANQADMLRLNVAVPPTAEPNTIGLIAGDAAGFPNGRRVIDDVVAIELRGPPSPSSTRRSPPTRPARASRTGRRTPLPSRRTWTHSPTWGHRPGDTRRRPARPARTTCSPCRDEAAGRDT